MATDKPIFYFDNRSPPVRTIRLLKESLKIDMVEKHIDLFKGEHLSEDYLKVYYIIIYYLKSIVEMRGWFSISTSISSLFRAKQTCELIA